MQTRKAHAKTNEIVSKANRKLTYEQAKLERALLKGIAGDCLTRVSGLAKGDNPNKARSSILHGELMSLITERYNYSKNPNVGPCRWQAFVCLS